MRNLKKVLQNFFKKVFPLFLISISIALFFWKFFIKGYIPIPADFVVGTYYPWLDYKWGYEVQVPVKNPITADVVSFSFPVQNLAIDLLKKKEMPLWNPYILSGTPLLANFQSAPFAINNIFYVFFKTETAWSLKIISQHFLVALFTYLLLRYWKVSKFSSFLGGVLFAFSGFNTIWSQWGVHTLSSSFIPLIILFLDKYLKRKKLNDLLFFSLSIFLQILSGYPQLVLYSFIAILTLLLVRFRKEREFLIGVFGVITFFIFGILLSSFQLLPAWELLALSQRKVEFLEFSSAFLPWAKVITFIAPDFFGNPSTRNYWGPTDYTTTTGFVGVTSFILAFAGLSSLKQKREVLFSGLVALFSLIISFPTPLAILIRNSHLLGLQAASAHRALVLFNFAISCLMAFGIDYLSRKKVKILRVIFLTGVLLLAFGVYALLGYFSSNLDIFQGLVVFPKKEMLFVSLRNLAIPNFCFFLTLIFLLISNKNLLGFRKIAPFLLSLLIFLEVFRFFDKFTPFSKKEIFYPRTPVLDFLIDKMEKEGPFRVTTEGVIPINIKMVYKIESLEGYDAVYPLDIAKFIAVVNSLNPEVTPQGRYASVSNVNSHLLDLANTRYFLGLKVGQKGNSEKEGNVESRFNSKKFLKVYEDKTTVVLENKDFLPRAFVVYDWEVVPKRGEILERLVDKSFPFREKILLEEEPRIFLSKEKYLSPSVDYEFYSAQKSVIKVNSSKEGLLFVSDLFYPGWKAFVNEKPVRILKANYAFRAVPIPKGESKVMFIYIPDSFKIGLFLSGFTFIFLLSLLFYESVFQKGRRAS